MAVVEASLPSPSVIGSRVPLGRGLWESVGAWLGGSGPAEAPTSVVPEDAERAERMVFFFLRGIYYIICAQGGMDIGGGSSLTTEG